MTWFWYLQNNRKEKEHKKDTVFTETGDDDIEFLEEDEGVLI